MGEWPDVGTHFVNSGTEQIRVHAELGMSMNLGSTR